MSYFDLQQPHHASCAHCVSPSGNRSVSFRSFWRSDQKSVDALLTCSKSSVISPAISPFRSTTGEGVSVDFNDFHCHTRQMHCLHTDKKLLVLHMLLRSCCKCDLFFMCFIRCRCFYRDVASKDPKTGEIASNFRSRCWIMDIWIFREFQSPPAHISLCNVNPGSRMSVKLQGLTFT